MAILYEEVWEEPVPETHAPPQNIPARKKLSPSPELWPYVLCFGAGLFIGLPIGREVIKLAADISETEIKRRVEQTKAKRGL